MSILTYLVNIIIILFKHFSASAFVAFNVVGRKEGRKEGRKRDR